MNKLKEKSYPIDSLNTTGGCKILLDAKKSQFKLITVICFYYGSNFTLQFYL